VSLNHAKGYADAGEAARSKAVVQFGHEIVLGCPCGEVHVRKPKVQGKRQRAAARNTGPSTETRAMVYARDLGWCVRCGVVLANVAHSCHHRWLLSQLGPNEFSNLLSLCGTGTTGCHGWAHAHVAEALAAGYLVRSGIAPASVPVKRAVPGGGYVFQWPTEDGDWANEDPLGVAA
jgi:hypothetical protein